VHFNALESEQKLKKTTEIGRDFTVNVEWEEYFVFFKLKKKVKRILRLEVKMDSNPPLANIYLRIIILWVFILGNEFCLQTKWGI